MPQRSLHRTPRRQRRRYSVDSRGDSFDDALAESINGLHKTELVCNKGEWRDLDELEVATLEWVDWFNHRRLFHELGGIPPAEFDDLHCRRYHAGHEDESGSGLIASNETYFCAEAALTPAAVPFLFEEMLGNQL